MSCSYHWLPPGSSLEHLFLFCFVFHVSIFSCTAPFLPMNVMRVIETALEKYSCREKFFNERGLKKPSTYCSWKGALLPKSQQPLVHIKIVMINTWICGVILHFHTSVIFAFSRKVCVVGYDKRQTCHTKHWFPLARRLPLYNMQKERLRRPHPNIKNNYPKLYKKGTHSSEVISIC